MMTGFRVLIFFTGVSEDLSSFAEICLSVWEVSDETVVGKGEVELGLGEIGSWILPWAICCAHLVSSRDFVFDPGGLPTEI